MSEPPEHWDKWFGEKPPNETLLEEAPPAPSTHASVAPARAGEPAVGQRIGAQYRVLRTIGSGGMGMVVHGVDESLDRNVAIKLINARDHDEEWMQDRFVQEARAMARVRHPNVVEIFAFGEHEDKPYFVMEYVEGQNLQDWLAARGDSPLSVDEALGILDQLCRGVSAIHLSGAVHRDIKPANVLIGNGLRVAVTDLGLATKLHRSDTNAQPRSGTPGYMAPEIIDGRAVPPELLAAADVYAVGAIAFELITGRRAFLGKAPLEVMAAQIAEDPPAPSEVRADLPPVFDEAILAAMHRDPEMRTASVEELRRQLLRQRAGLRQGERISRILVADDDAASRTSTAQLLSASFEGAQVDVACDGVEALEAIRRHRPDVVVSDLHMPRMLGGELLATLREDPRTADIPVIVVTGVGGASDWQRLNELGATGFLVKPVDPDALIAILRRAVR